MDSDGDGLLDMLDGILPFQLPHFFNAEYDFADPIRVYRLGWALSGTPTSEIVLLHRPTLSGESLNRVYLDAFGTFADYSPVADMLVFVPCPPGLVAVLGGLAIAMRRCRHESFNGEV